MAVRLAFSVAMLADADILLMDEVLAVGDARFQEKCFEVFAEYKRENRTIVLVSHDLTAMDLYCERAFYSCCQDGRLVAERGGERCHRDLSPDCRIDAGRSRYVDGRSSRPPARRSVGVPER